MLNGLSGYETAVALLERGLWPIPLHPPGIMLPGRDRPTKGKEPIHESWGRRLPSKADLRTDFRKYPRAGVGLRLGLKGGIVDLEVDGPDGCDSMRRLFGGDPETLGWSSRRGPHRLFVYPDSFLGAPFKASKFTLDGFPGLECRIGKFDSQLHSACPPSVGEDGEPRRWNGHDTIAELSAVAIEQIVALAPMMPRTSPQESAGSSLVAGSAYGAKALAEECASVAVAVEGTRHDTLRAAALRIGSLAKSGVLEWTASAKELFNAAIQCGLPPDEIRDIFEWVWQHAGPRLIHIPPLGGGCEAGAQRAASICIKTEPAGAALDRVKARIPHVNLPASLEGNRKLAPLARTMTAMAEEAERRGDRNFHAPYRLIGKLSGIESAMTTMRRLAALSQLGYLDLLDPGIPGTKATGKANTWRWHDPPRRGETVWNSHANNHDAHAAGSVADIQGFLGNVPKRVDNDEVELPGAAEATPDENGNEIIDITRFLGRPAAREGFYLELFKEIDPLEDLTIPALLDAAAEVLSKEGEVPIIKDRHPGDVAACRGIAEMIRRETDKAVRLRLQDLDDHGVARLIELASRLAGHAAGVDDVVEILDEHKGEILAAIDRMAA